MAMNWGLMLEFNGLREEQGVRVSAPRRINAHSQRVCQIFFQETSKSAYARVLVSLTSYHSIIP